MKEIHLKKSPIREAIIDFKFNFSSPVDIQKLDRAHEELIATYPTKEVIDFRSLSFDLSADNKPKIEHSGGKVGYRFMSAQKDIIVQFRVDGFTFSKIEPYTSWEDILKKAQEAYEVYVKTTSISTITRIATRYINFISIEEEEAVDIKKYLNIYPVFPEVINSPIENFLIRVALNDEGINAKAIISQGLIGEMQGDGVLKKSLLLDIDCYKEGLAADISSPWDLLQDVKDYTNRIFFSGVTEFTINKFK